MTRLPRTGIRRTTNRLRWAIVCLSLTVLVGCQSILKSQAKANALKAQDRFSCGEPLPGKIP